MEGDRAAAGRREGAQTLPNNPEAHLEGTMQDPMLSTSMNDEFNQFKAEQRTLLEQRNQIQKRIESMRREYDFIQNLDARDVNYVVEKKREHAALLVQRNWRRLRAEREYRKQKQGMRRELHDYEKTDADLEKIRQNRDNLEKTRAYFMASRPDNFYAKISEDRKDVLQEQVIKARQLQSEHQLAQLNPIDCYDEYLPRSNRFNNDFQRNEYVRAQGHDMLIQSKVMSQFLVTFDDEVIEKANVQIPHSEDPAERSKLEDEAAAAAANRIKEIKVWGEIADNFTNEEKADVIREHKERMARYRKRKDWEAWIEEDELDIEGDRIISEIKNYKSEHFWNTKFYV